MIIITSKLTNNNHDKNNITILIRILFLIITTRITIIIIIIKILFIIIINNRPHVRTFTHRITSCRIFSILLIDLLQDFNGLVVSSLQKQEHGRLRHEDQHYANAECCEHCNIINTERGNNNMLCGCVCGYKRW